MEVIREGEPIALTAEEFKILKFFLHNQDRDVSRDELLNEVRDHHDFSCLRTIDNHILKLRQKLGKKPGEPCPLPHHVPRRVQVRPLNDRGWSCAPGSNVA